VKPSPWPRSGEQSTDAGVPWGSRRSVLCEREIRKDASFGGSLRRLRLQKGISRSDFAPLSSKTIARVERGEVEVPHGDTLEAIARRLGVPAAEIGSY
jgi:hypothetical protein